MTSVVALQGWYAQPIHCPFCGEKIEPPETIGCKHQLYLIFGGEFLYVGENLVKTLGLPEDPFLEDPTNGSWDISEFGSVKDIVARAADAFVNLVEFQIDNVPVLNQLTLSMFGKESQ